MITREIAGYYCVKVFISTEKNALGEGRHHIFIDGKLLIKAELTVRLGIYILCFLDGDSFIQSYDHRMSFSVLSHESHGREPWGFSALLNLAPKVAKVSRGNHQRFLLLFKGLLLCILTRYISSHVACKLQSFSISI